MGGGEEWGEKKGDGKSKVGALYTPLVKGHRECYVSNVVLVNFIWPIFDASPIKEFLDEEKKKNPFFTNTSTRLHISSLLVSVIILLHKHRLLYHHR